MKKILNCLIVVVSLFIISINTYALEYQECYNYKVVTSGDGEEVSGIPDNIFKCSDTKNIIANNSDKCYKTKLFRSNYFIYNVELQKKGSSNYLSASEKNSKYDHCDVVTLSSCTEIKDNKTLCKALDGTCKWLNGGCGNIASSATAYKMTDQSVCDKYNTAIGGTLPNTGNLAIVSKTACEADGCYVKDNKCTAYSTEGRISGRGNGNNSGTGELLDIGQSAEATCEGIFGDFQDDIYKALKAISIIGPILVGAFSVYEYLIAVIKSDADELKKCNSRLIKRLILMALLFILPYLVNLLLKLLGDEYGVVCLPKNS